MSGSLENWTLRILNQLGDALNPADSSSDVDPTEALHDSLDNNPSWTLLALAHIITEAEDAAIRTLALVLLRRFPHRAVGEDAQSLIWDVVPQSTCSHVYAALLADIEQPRNDSTDAEINALCASVSSLADHVGVAEWPGLVDTMQRLSRLDATMGSRARFYKIVFEAPALMTDYEPSDMLKIFESGLAVVDNTQTPVLALKAVLAVLQTDHKAEDLLGILPSMLEVFPALLCKDYQTHLSIALTAFLGIFTSYNEVDLHFSLLPYLTEFFPFVLNLFDASLQTPVRMAAIELAVTITEMLGSHIGFSLSHLHHNASQSLLQIMAEIPDTANDALFWNDDSADFTKAELDAIDSVAEDAISRMAKALGPSSVLPAVIEQLPSLLSSEDWKPKWAGLSILGTLTETCHREYHQDFPNLMQLILPFLSSSNHRVLYATVYVIAELAEFLEGALQHQYGHIVLPAFLQLLSSTTTVPPRLIAYVCSCIVNYTEDLRDLPQSLLDHSMPLFSELHSLITNSLSREDVKLKAMAAIAQLATALGTNSLLPTEVYRAIMHAIWRHLDGDAPDAVRSGAMSCATLVASAAPRTAVMADANRLMTSLLHIQQTHQEPEDPCTSQVLIALVRMAEILRADFVPHVDAVVPHLLCLANKEPAREEQPSSETIGEAANDDDDDEEWYYAQTATGRHCYVHSETMREKTEAIELLSALSRALGCYLAEVGNSDTTTGDWVSYAQMMLEMAADYTGYVLKAEIRIAASSMLAPLVGALRGGSKHSAAYIDKIVSAVVPSLLEAMSYEIEPKPLVEMMSATRELLALHQDIFPAESAGAFASACVKQIDDTAAAIFSFRDSEHETPEYLEMQGEASEVFLSMSPTLKAFLQYAGSRFPFSILISTVDQALHGKLNMSGEKHWALRAIADALQYGGINAVPWTAAYLPIVRTGLSDNDPVVRQICAYTVGAAAIDAGDRFSGFCKGCIPTLQTWLSVPTSTKDDRDIIYARDNAIAALCKIAPNDDYKSIDISALLSAIPVQLDGDEIDACCNFLFALIAKDHPMVAPANPEGRATAFSIFSRLKSSTLVVASLSDSLRAGEASYLARCPIDQ